MGGRRWGKMTGNEICKAGIDGIDGYGQRRREEGWYRTRRKAGNRGSFKSIIFTNTYTKQTAGRIAAKPVRSAIQSYTFVCVCVCVCVCVVSARLCGSAQCVKNM